MANVLLFIGREGHRYYGDESYFNQELEADERAVAQTKRFLDMSPGQQETYLRLSADPLETLRHHMAATNQAFWRIYNRLKA